MRYGSKVEYHRHPLPAFPDPLKHYDALFAVGTIDPPETFRRIVKGEQFIPLKIKVVQLIYIYPLNLPWAS